MVPHFEHKLFLTATPHNGYQESFSALLELLDDQRFARGTMPDRKQLGAVMVRRLKSELPKKFDGTDRFPKRMIEPMEVAYTAEEKAVHAALKKYTKLRHENVADNTEKMATEFVLLTLKKRLFSSPAAFAATLEQHERSLADGQATNGHASSPPSASFNARSTRWRKNTPTMQLSGRGHRRCRGSRHPFVPRTDRRRGGPAEANAGLGEYSQGPWRQQIRPSWSSGSRDTFAPTANGRTIGSSSSPNTGPRRIGCKRSLPPKGFSGNDRLMTMYGGMDSEQREAVKAAFQTAPDKSPVRILLATDAASEGFDLQNFCCRLIHYEIPWNPNRMEQRNGRIDRHGQRHNPLVFHFVGKGYKEREKLDVDVPVGELEGDLEFLMRAVRKVEAIREDLGKVGPVIADQVQEAMLGQRKRLDTQQAEKDAEPAEQDAQDRAGH